MMKVTVTEKGLNEEAQWWQKNTDKLRPELRTLVQVTSLRLMERVKEEMPVLTGRAQRGWGQGSPEAIWQDNTGGSSGPLSIMQGTEVPYTEALNAGSSRKAPAGFIDRAYADLQKDLDQATERALERFLNRK